MGNGETDARLGVIRVDTDDRRSIRTALHHSGEFSIERHSFDDCSDGSGQLLHIDRWSLHLSRCEKIHGLLARERVSNRHWLALHGWAQDLLDPSPLFLVEIKRHIAWLL